MTMHEIPREVSHYDPGALGERFSSAELVGVAITLVGLALIMRAR
jgi:hypothetical protein